MAAVASTTTAASVTTQKTFRSPFHKLIYHSVSSETTKATRIAVDGGYLFAIDPKDKTKVHQKKLGVDGIIATYHLEDVPDRINRLAAGHGLVAAVGKNGSPMPSQQEGSFLKGCADNIRLWNVGNPTPVKDWAMPVNNYPRSLITSLIFTPAKQLLLTRSDEQEFGFLFFIDLGSMQSLPAWGVFPHDEQSGIDQVIFNSDNTFFARNDDRIYLFDVRKSDKKPVRTFPSFQREQVVEMAVHGESLFTGGKSSSKTGKSPLDSNFLKRWDTRMPAMPSEAPFAWSPHFIAPLENCLVVGSRQVISTLNHSFEDVAPRMSFDNVNFWVSADVRERQMTLLASTINPNSSTKGDYQVMHFELPKSGTASAAASKKDDSKAKK